MSDREDLPSGTWRTAFPTAPHGSSSCRHAGTWPTAGIERISFRRDGEPAGLTLRATQVYLREDGKWKVAHRHADALTE
ncbi:nuclear transport factor 2 family protein [Arthrobacter sp. DNA4]|nr:nuclear transport factor 2 family protein [Arthrobacter sp. DNA4]UTT70530.1 nuclear transport factor 2 family protein [Arthrobacter sp. DNA4]